MEREQQKLVEEEGRDREKAREGRVRDKGWREKEGKCKVHGAVASSWGHTYHGN